MRFLVDIDHPVGLRMGLRVVLILRFVMFLENHRRLVRVELILCMKIILCGTG